MADNPGGGKPPPSTNDLRKTVPGWNLAGDKNLLELMESMHENMMHNIKSVNGKISNLISDLDTASISLQNVNNRFNGLSNTQFIENRVYDDDDEVMVSGGDKTNIEEIIPKVNKNNSKEELVLDAKEQELLATSKSLQVLESFYEEIQIVPDSDSESDLSEDDAQISDSIVLQPKNLYVDQPLPHIIGSIQWKNKWHVGLVNEESESDSDDEMGVKRADEEIDLSSSGSEGACARQRPADRRDKVIVEAHNAAKLCIHDNSEVQSSDDIGSDTDSENYLNHSRNVNRNLESSKVAEKPTIGTKPLSTSTASDFAAELAKKLRGASNAAVKAPMEDDNSRRQPPSATAKNGPALKSRFSEKPPERIVGRVFSDEPPPLDSQDNAETEDLFGANDTDCETDDLFADIRNPTNLFGPPRHQSSAYGGLFDNIGERGHENSGATDKDDIFGNSFESEDKGLFLSGSTVKRDVGDKRKVGGGLFDDILNEEEDDLFGSRKVGERSKDLIGKVSDSKSKTKTSSGLFDNASEDETALFGTSATLPAVNSVSEQQNVNKKPIGGVSMLGNQNASIAAALKQRRKPTYSSDSDESSTPDVHRVEPIHDRPLPPKPAPKTIDKLVTNKAVDKPATNKTVDNPVTNKIIDQGVVSKKPLESKTSKNYIFSDENDIFADDNLFFSNNKIEPRSRIDNDNSNVRSEMKSHSLFDDLSDDENSLFGPPTKMATPVPKNDPGEKPLVDNETKVNNLDKLLNDKFSFEDTSEHGEALFAKCDSRNANKIKDSEKAVLKSVNDNLIDKNVNAGQQGEKVVISNVKGLTNEASSVLNSDNFKKTENEVLDDVSKINEKTLRKEGVKITETVKPQIDEDIFVVKKMESSNLKVDQGDLDNIFGETKATGNEKPKMNDLEKALFGTESSDTVETSIFNEEPPDIDHVVEDVKASNVNYLFGEDDEDYYTAFKSSKSFLDDLPSGTGTLRSGYDFLTDEPPELDDEAVFGDSPRWSGSANVSNEAALKASPRRDEKDEFSSTENLFASTNMNVSKNFDSIFKESDNIFGSSKIGKDDKLFGDLDSDSHNIFGIPYPLSVDTTSTTTVTQPETPNQLSATPDIVKPVVAKRKEIKELPNVATSPVETSPTPNIAVQKPDITNVKPKILNKRTLVDNKTEAPKSEMIRSESEIDGASQSLRIHSEETSTLKTVGKLKISNLNININALKPGASPKKWTPIEKTTLNIASSKTVSKSVEKTKTANVSKPRSEMKNSLPKSISFEAEPETPVLSNVVSKERARIQVKRRPSSRKARKDALRKSALNLDVTDGFSVPQDSEPDNFTYSLPNSPQSILDESTKVIGTFEEQFRDIMGIKKLKQSTEDNNLEASMDEPKIISTLGKVYKNIGRKSGVNDDKSEEVNSDEDEKLFKKGCKSKEIEQNIDQDLKQSSESSKNKSLFEEKIDIASKLDKKVGELNAATKINDKKDNIIDNSEKRMTKTNLENTDDEEHLFKTKPSKEKKSEVSKQSISINKSIIDPFDDDNDLFKPKSNFPEKTKSDFFSETDTAKVDRKNVESDHDFLFDKNPERDIIKAVIAQKINSELTHDNTREFNEEEIFKSQPTVKIKQPLKEAEKSLSEKSEKTIQTDKTKSENSRRSDEDTDLFKPNSSMPSSDAEDLFGAKPKAAPKTPLNEDMFKQAPSKKSDPPKKQQNLIFQDSESDDDLFSGKKVNKPPQKVTSAKENLPTSRVANPSFIFGDEEESFDDIFSGSKKSSAFSKGYEKTKPLFEETNDEDDIFGVSTSSKSKSSKISNSDSTMSTKKTIQSIASSAEQVFQDPLSLFDEE